MRGNRFTIYDALEKKGYFASNPANADARTPTGDNLYQGPVQYPKMLYHPLGEERVTTPAEIVSTPMGAKLVGEQREMLNTTVNSAEEERALLEEGWHQHPSLAVRARVMALIEAHPDMAESEKKKLMKAIPAMGAVDRISQLEAEIKRLQGLQDAEKALQPQVQIPVEAPANALAPAKVKPAAAAPPAT